MQYGAPSPSQLGLVPAVIGGAVLIEAAWAWYDPDFFMAVWAGADQEEQVIRLNNWWAELEITGRATLSYSDPVWQQLDGAVAGWVAWRDAYNEAILRRWWSDRDWDAELEVWYLKFRETSAAVAEAGGIEAERRMQRAGHDPRLLPEADQGMIEEFKEAIGETIEQAGEAGERAGGGAGKSLVWPAMALGATVGFLVWLGTREAPPRRRQGAPARRRKQGARMR
jgi:hypothetical protein